MKIDKLYDSLGDKVTPIEISLQGHEVLELRVVHSNRKGPPLNRLDSFAPITVEQTERALASTKSGSPSDLAPPFIMSLLAMTLSTSLTKVCNVSLDSSIFPDKWKKAYIKPLLKKATIDPLDLKNYRPISLLHSCSKVREINK